MQWWLWLYDYGQRNSNGHQYLLYGHCWLWWVNTKKSSVMTRMNEYEVWINASCLDLMFALCPQSTLLTQPWPAWLTSQGQPWAKKRMEEYSYLGILRLIRINHSITALYGQTFPPSINSSSECTPNLSDMQRHQFHNVTMFCRDMKPSMEPSTCRWMFWIAWDHIAIQIMTTKLQKLGMQLLSPWLVSKQCMIIQASRATAWPRVQPALIWLSENPFSVSLLGLHSCWPSLPPQTQLPYQSLPFHRLKQSLVSGG